MKVGGGQSLGMPQLKADITDKIRLESDSTTSTTMVCIHILRTDSSFTRLPVP